VWETLLRGCARALRRGLQAHRQLENSARSAFNSRRTMPGALAAVIAGVGAELVVVSYNDEAWLTLDELVAMCSVGGRHVAVLGFDSKRYVGAQIGIHNPKGERVGRVSHLRNTELLAIGGPRDLVEKVVLGVVSQPSPKVTDSPLKVAIR
jgi:adenine-specific DNA-methyltransferase